MMGITILIMVVGGVCVTSELSPAAADSSVMASLSVTCIIYEKGGEVVTAVSTVRNTTVIL